jgi:hypothetical protein
VPGIVVFHSLAEAVRMGFQIYDRIPEGYLVQRETERGRALAIVIESSSAGASESELVADGFKG